MSVEDVTYCRKCRKRICIVDVYTGATYIGECQCPIPTIGASCRVEAPDGTPVEPPKPKAGQVIQLRPTGAAP